MDEAFFRAFAYPAHSTSSSGDPYYAMIGAYLTAIRNRVQRALLARGAGLRSAAPDRVPVIQPTLERLAVAWRPELGRTRNLLDEGDAMAAYVQYLLAMTGLGATGEWRAHLDKDATVFFAGYSFSVTGSLTIASQGGSLEIRDDRGPLIGFSCAEGTWHRTAIALRLGPPPLEPHDTALGSRPLYTCVGELVELAPTLRGKEGSWLSAEATDRLIGVIDTAFRLIERETPEYLSWVERVVRGFLIVGGDDRLVVFGSHTRWPGLVIVDDRIHPVLAAEILVHESSHQYHALISSAFPLLRGQDQREFYSPFMKKERPLARILLAYHSAVNMALFYIYALRVESERRGMCERNLAELREEIDQLRLPLTETDDLTPAGETLWRSLDERLQHTLAEASDHRWIARA